nr:MAG TPA: hypothetical protein [Caudoviricetes sp.]DAP51551.1 MAG TPA: hypothetical protein [Caudoviricetes sp.]DAU94398.1 MAG TPA: hypothetical protein [Caudoviricetes sp.]
MVRIRFQSKCKNLIKPLRYLFLYSFFSSTNRIY